MKVEININTDGLVSEITQEVRKAIKLVLSEMAVNDTLFTVETLAKYLDVSKQWVYERVHMKEIPHIKMGKFPRFLKSDVDSWLYSLKIPNMQLLSPPLKVIKKSSSYRKE